MPRLLLIYSLVLCCFAARPSLAQGTDARAQAKELARRAQERRGAGDMKGALELYRKAYDTFPSPYLLWPQAELYLATDRLAEARETLDRHERAFPQNAYPPDQGPAEIQALRGRIAARETEIAAQKQRPAQVVAPPPEPKVAPPPPVTVVRTEPAGGRAPRRLTWLSYAGIPAGVLGLGLLTFGGIALGVDGQCVDSARPCDMRYDIRTEGIGTMVAGGVLLGVGVTFVAIDLSRGLSRERHRRDQAREARYPRSGLASRKRLASSPALLDPS